jgi:hypothetical protein
MVFREGRCGEGTDPHGWGAENAGNIGDCSEGRATRLPASKSKNEHLYFSRSILPKGSDSSSAWQKIVVE